MTDGTPNPLQLSLVALINAEVAQSVEHMTENHGVGSSILPLGTLYFNNLQPHRVTGLTSVVTQW